MFQGTGGDQGQYYCRGIGQAPKSSRPEDPRVSEHPEDLHIWTVTPPRQHGWCQAQRQPRVVQVNAALATSIWGLSILVSARPFHTWSTLPICPSRQHTCWNMLPLMALPGSVRPEQEAHQFNPEHDHTCKGDVWKIQSLYLPICCTLPTFLLCSHCAWSNRQDHWMDVPLSRAEGCRYPWARKGREWVFWGTNFTVLDLACSKTLPVSWRIRQWQQLGTFKPLQARY